jgi:hypothetical protein
MDPASGRFASRSMPVEPRAQWLNALILGGSFLQVIDHDRLDRRFTRIELQTQMRGTRRGSRSLSKKFRMNLMNSERSAGTAVGYAF